MTPQDDYDRPEFPVNPIPPLIVALFIVLMGIEMVFTLGSYGMVGGPGAIGWRLDALQDYSFAPQFLDYMTQTGQAPPELLIRLLSYAFVHGSFTNALFAGVMLLALGKFVAEAMHPVASLALFALASIVGAVAFGLLAPESREPLMGAFPAVYGFIGAFTWMLYVRLGHLGEKRVMAFRLIGVLMAIQLIFAIFFEIGLAWIADLAGFAAGFILTPLLVPGGFVRLRERMRRD